MSESTQVNTRSRREPVALEDTMARQYLTFTLGGETFAMEIHYIREIIQFEGITHVPLMPDFTRGVINLRGAVVPVIDLSVRFRRPPTELTKRTCIVILELGPEGKLSTFGIMVDNVSEVLEIQPDEIEAPPSFGGSLRSDFIQGVGKIAGKFVILLDVEQTISVEEMAALASGVQTSPDRETVTP